MSSKEDCVDLFRIIVVCDDKHVNRIEVDPPDKEIGAKELMAFLYLASAMSYRVALAEKTGVVT